MSEISREKEQLMDILSKQKQFLQTYLEHTRHQQSLLQEGDIDENAVEASIYKRKLIIKEVDAFAEKAEELRKDMAEHYAKSEEIIAMSLEIRALLQSIQTLDMSNIELVKKAKDRFLAEYKKMAQENEGIRSYAKAGTVSGPSILDREM